MKELPEKRVRSRDDERDLVLKGYVAFLDPPKPSATSAIQALQRHGVGVKFLTGDTDCSPVRIDVGPPRDPMLLGDELEKCLTPNSLTQRNRATPSHAYSRAQAANHPLPARQGSCGRIHGDGINDAQHCNAADIGISVDTVTQIAKESADLILLEKDLMVLEGGVIEGRKVFANILKYILMVRQFQLRTYVQRPRGQCLTPVLPMTPIQNLSNNMLDDFSQAPIPTDVVDEELVALPRPWNIKEIKGFILCIGPISSIFDYTTFFVMSISSNAGLRPGLRYFRRVGLSSRL